MRSMSALFWGSTFFASSMDSNETQMDETLYLIKKGFSYSDVFTMPVYLRKYYSNRLISLQKGTG